MKKVIITIPTYQEKENIVDLINQILNINMEGYDIHVLVIDDDSPDLTWMLVFNEFKSNMKVDLIRRTINKGRGSAGREGFKVALKNGADIIIEMDADFSHNPVFIPRMLNTLKDADLVLGSRMVSGGMQVGRPWFRRLITWGANLYIRIVLGVKVKDCNSGFRAYKRGVFSKVNVKSIMAKGPDIVQEILYKVHLGGFKIKEVPIVFKERERGFSTLTFEKVLKGYINVLRLKWLGFRGKL